MFTTPQYKPFISLVFLISVCLIIFYVLSALYKWFSVLIKKRITKRHVLEYLKELTPIQKEALRNYTNSKTRTILFPMDHGAARELEGEGILYRTTGYIDGGGYMNFSITDWVWNILKEHPEILN